MIGGNVIISTTQAEQAVIVDALPFLIDGDTGFLFTARTAENATPIGCLQMRTTGRVAGDLRSLFVVPHMRRNYVGAALLQAAMQQAIALGARAINALVNQDNMASRCFFQKQGFFTGQRNGGDLWMVKDLREKA